MGNMTWINGSRDGPLQSVLTLDLRLLSARVMGTMFPRIQHHNHRFLGSLAFRQSFDAHGGFMLGATGAVKSCAFF